MVKSNLTESQTNIIKQLTNEFNKINTAIPESNHLIDVNEIIENSRLEQEFLKEIELANKTFNKLKIDAMLNDMESIRGDLAKLNIGIQQSYVGANSFTIFPTHKPFQNIESYYKIRITYKNTHHLIRKYKDIERHIDCQYKICFDGSFTQYSKTFNEFIKTESFKDTLKTLYEQTLNKV